MARFRLVHTSDWHLGHTLHGFARSYEHNRFLDWLGVRLAELEADALVVTGDIYDKQNPPTVATSLLYRFIAGVKRRCPMLDVVLIGGNHDSAGRLEAPQPLLNAFGVHVVGSLPWRDDGRVDTDRVLVPLTDSQGDIAAWCAAVPFLRPGDLTADAGGEHPAIAGTQSVYGDVARAMETARESRQAAIVTGHCTVRGATLSEMSERHILVGGQHALPVDAIAAAADYVALGHLHRLQSVGGNGAHCYAGSPIPLAVDERSYRHRIVVVDFDGGRLADTLSLEIPRRVEFLRVPETGAASLDDVLEALDRLQPDASGSAETRPFLEVAVAVTEPVPDLRQRVEAALAGKAVRLTRIVPHHPGDDSAAAAALATTRELATLQPEDVFRMRHRQRYETEPDAALLDAFRSLLAEVGD